jgi:hypothetical protein
MKLVVIFFYLGSLLFFAMLQMKLMVILFYLGSPSASHLACSSPVGSPPVSNPSYLGKLHPSYHLVLDTMASLPFLLPRVRNLPWQDLEVVSSTRKGRTQRSRQHRVMDGGHECHQGRRPMFLFSPPEMRDTPEACSSL